MFALPVIVCVKVKKIRASQMNVGVAVASVSKVETHMKRRCKESNRKN
jgi:hypothetical protein